MNLNAIMMWQAFITQAVGLGVKSWSVIRAAMQDAGADDATINALSPKWDALHDDVARAAAADK